MQVVSVGVGMLGSGLATDEVPLRDSAMIRGGGESSMVRSAVTVGSVLLMWVWLLAGLGKVDVLTRVGSVWVHLIVDWVRLDSGSGSVEVHSDEGPSKVHPDTGLRGVFSGSGS